MKSDSPLILAAGIYRWIARTISAIGQPLFLLVVRLYWGWQFFITGKGKLGNLAKVTDYFQSLGIPHPALNARIAGCNECFCGLLLLAGVAGRITSVPLIVTMCVAYWTASHDAVTGFFNNSDPFFKDDAFPFLMASLLVFIFGPGPLSVDGLAGWFWKKRASTAQDRSVMDAGVSGKSGE